ncbi:MAG: STAS domain-containing protein [Candidatus Gracilibacteria bacterium]|jgi:anti-anti-sigma factor
MSESTGTFAEVTLQETNGISIMTFTGELDETNVDAIFKKVYDLFTGKYIIFSFSGVTYGNSKFIGYVASMYDYIEEKEGEMVICECQPVILDTLDMAGIFLMIPSTPTLEEALVKIGASV